MEYTLSIEDRVGTGAHVTERAVKINGTTLTDKDSNEIGVYNPNATPKEGFNPYDPTTFDTPFSIVHPFRDLAKLIAGEYVKGPFPKLKYDISVNDAQRILFENILADEVKKAWERNNQSSKSINFPPPIILNDIEYAVLGHDERIE